MILLLLRALIRYGYIAGFHINTTQATIAATSVLDLLIASAYALYTHYSLAQLRVRNRNLNLQVVLQVSVQQERRQKIHW